MGIIQSSTLYIKLFNYIQFSVHRKCIKYM